MTSDPVELTWEQLDGEEEVPVWGHKPLRSSTEKPAAQGKNGRGTN